MTELWIALALVCVIEGMMPFLVPEKWQKMLYAVSQQPPKSIRIFGLIMIVTGAVWLHWLKS